MTGYTRPTVMHPYLEIYSSHSIFKLTIVWCPNLCETYLRLYKGRSQ